MLGNVHIAEIDGCHTDHPFEQFGDGMVRRQEWQTAFSQQLRSKWDECVTIDERGRRHFSYPANLPEEPAQHFLGAIWAKGGWQDMIEVDVMLVLTSVMIDNAPRDSVDSDDFWLLEYCSKVQGFFYDIIGWTHLERQYYDTLILNAGLLARAVVDEKDISSYVDNLLVDWFMKNNREWWLTRLAYLFGQK